MLLQIQGLLAMSYGIFDQVILHKEILCSWHFIIVNVFQYFWYIAV